MKERYAKLLILLENHREGIAGKQLADNLGVTTRSVRNYVKDLNGNYLKGAQIVASPDHGYFIQGKITDITETGQLEFEQRAFFIVKYLMTRTDYVSYEELARELHYSSPTIRADIYRIQELIHEEKRTVDLQAVIFKGVSLSGDELAVRFLLDSFFNPKIATFSQLEREYNYYFEKWTNHAEIHVLIEFLKNQFVQKNIKPTPELIKPIASFIIIAAYRDNVGQWLNHDLQQSHQLTAETLHYARHVLDQGKRMLGSVAPCENEVWSFAWLLVSQQLLTNDIIFDPDDQNVNPQLAESINQALTQLATVYHQPFLQDRKLFTDLLLHTSRDLFPLEYQFYIENSYLHHIKTDYILAYQYAVDFASALIESLNLKIPDNEIGYYALHFAAFLERNHQRALNIAVVYARRPVSGQLLASRIEEVFDNVQVTMIVSAKQVTEIKQVAFIVAANEAVVESDYPVIYVSDWLNAQDNHKLQKQISQVILRQVLQGSQLIHGKFKDKASLIETVLTDMGLPELYDNIMHREQLSSTETGNFAAIPHPMQIPDVPEFELGIVVLDEPMKWDEHLVKLVIVVIPTQEQLSRYALVFDELQRVVTNDQIPDLLSEINSVDDFIDLVVNTN
ncbi:BglG family transcription antiterminator [Lactiplantibacillus daowaiensis]|uniref:BglG family transcription antiterminator n=1 Tax=Lactiplantibacillus daowaiensis TaxID=2559918 RepID=A0ABW1S0T1_9LACO|nr:HTH domain-containing protein [Lactiplantibacillus daowaiensis]